MAVASKVVCRGPEYPLELADTFSATPRALPIAATLLSAPMYGGKVRCRAPGDRS